MTVGGRVDLAGRTGGTEDADGADTGNTDGSATIGTFEVHRIGARIRTLRQDAGVSLTALARRLGVSASAISQIETGVMQPSVSRLVEIMGALGLPLSLVFDERLALSFPPPYALQSTVEQLPGVSVARAIDSTSVDLQEGVVYRRLAPRSLPGTEYFESTYPPGASSGPEGTFLAHAGLETGIVVSGRLTFQFSDGEVDLAAGDSISFPAAKGHRVVNSTADVAVATWLTVQTGLETA
jgi:transcriptional regulator with XRE-family HTH domain